MNNLLNFENPSDSKQNVQPNYSSQLTKTSSNNEIEQYFRAVLNLSQSNDEFPVDLDEVWPLVYAEKGKAVRALQENFIQDVDYQVFAQNGKNLTGGRPIDVYKLSVSCMEFFIARKVRPVFEVYRQVFHKVAQSNQQTLSRKELAQMIIEAEEEKERLLLTVETQEQELKASAPKVAYYDTTLNSKGLLTVNMIASVFGISAIKLNKLLCEWNIQYSQSGTYFLYDKHRGKEYAIHKPFPYTDSNGEIKTRQQLYWTEKGKEFILNLYSKKLTVTV